MRELRCGREYRYAHQEPEAYAAAETYFPDALTQRPAWYRPVERGLEVQIAEKLRKLRELDNLDGKKAVQSPENNESNNSQSIPK